MKTNVILKSTDRVLFGTTIKQQTKTKMLSVTDLQKAYTTARFQYGWNQKTITNILNNKSTIERVYYLLNERDLIEVTVAFFMKTVKKKGFLKVLKGIGVYETTGKGENRSTYADPCIWLIIAMELNPIFYTKAITLFIGEFGSNQIAEMFTETCNSDETQYKKDKQKGYVYLMIDNSNGRLKIGYSKDPKYREKTLQSEKPDIELLKYWKGGLKQERALHKIFSHKRIRGEWFDLDNDDLQMIENYFK